MAANKLTFTSASGERLGIEDAVSAGTVSLDLNPSITVDADDQEVVAILRAREAKGWVVQSKTSTKKDSE